ncbi:hypothetical protein PMAC_000403 [Pneumocystis sp. 'macacae']|nr:hypothetical protein PMAC_000403 [Pneumocystis sp. 'macacae']
MQRYGESINKRIGEAEKTGKVGGKQHIYKRNSKEQGIQRYIQGNKEENNEQKGKQGKKERKSVKYSGGKHIFWEMSVFKGY